MILSYNIILFIIILLILIKTNKYLELLFKSNNLDFDSFLFTTTVINDTYNAEILGPYQSYCIDGSCQFPQVKG